jgi:hypothetical protein
VFYIRIKCLRFKTLFCPQSVFMCSISFSQSTPIISLFSVNRLGFLTEAPCAPCEVRSKSLYISEMNFTFLDRAMDHAASCRPFTAKARFRSRSVHVRFVVGRSATAAGFLSSNFRRPLSVSCCVPVIHSYLILICVLLEGQAGEAWEPANNTVFFPI